MDKRSDNYRCFIKSKNLNWEQNITITTVHTVTLRNQPLCAKNKERSKRIAVAGRRLGKPKTATYYQEIIINFLEARFNSSVKLSDLAEIMEMNSNYLGRLIQTVFGKNFNSLLMEKRVEQAKILLRTEQYKNISQIAYQCGFNDSNYFSTVFRKNTSLSPRAYRKKTL